MLGHLIPVRAGMDERWTVPARDAGWIARLLRALFRR
jgi:hypothetical protein